MDALYKLRIDVLRYAEAYDTLRGFEKTEGARLRGVVDAVEERVRLRCQIWRDCWDAHDCYISLVDGWEGNLVCVLVN